MHNKSMKTILVLNIIMPLFFGFTIYILARPNSILINMLLGISFNITIPYFIRFNLPTALWLYSLCSCIFLIWRGINKWSIVFFLFILISSIFSECIQLFFSHNVVLGLNIGTFDIYDIITMLIMCSICLIINNILWSKRYEKVL